MTYFWCQSGQFGPCSANKNSTYLENEAEVNDRFFYVQVHTLKKLWWNFQLNRGPGRFQPRVEPLTMGHLHLIVRSKVTAQITIDPLISVKHFSSLSFLTFKLPESLGNRFRSILLDLEMNLEKKTSKNMYFFLSKMDFETQFGFFLEIFSVSFRESGISLIACYKGNLTFPKGNWKYFQKKSELCFKIHFRQEKIHIFRWFFSSKFISRSRRIDLNRFPSDSGSLKVRKLKEEKCLTEIRGSMEVTLDLTMILDLQLFEITVFRK